MTLCPGKRSMAAMNTEGGFSRVRFLSIVAAGTVGAEMFNVSGLRAAVSEMRVTGKPVLSQASLNALVPAVPNDAYYAMLRQAAADPKAFVLSHFAVTEKQRTILDAMTPQDVATIRTALTHAANNHLVLGSDCIAADGIQRGEKISSSRSYGAFAIKRVNPMGAKGAAGYQGEVVLRMPAAGP